jgi:probable HAF family extracellular repeat protein
MKTILTSIAASSLLAALAVAQPAPRYSVIELGPMGGTFSQAYFMNNNRLVGGVSTVRDGTQHATFWGLGLKMDIGTPGVNSAAFGINQSGQAAVQTEISTKDPNNENFCGYGTGLQCRASVWQGGVTTALPTLGGYNGTVGQINKLGEMAGIAENSTRDPECPPGVAFTGTGPQVLDFEAVIWGPAPGQIRELHPLPGDTVGMALWMNDNGQAVGASGRCGNTMLPPVAFGPHAVLWEKDGSVTDLGNLGAAVGNIGLAINNHGQVVGTSSLTAQSPPTTGIHAFLWTTQTGMRDLGALPGDVASVGASINDSGEVVGPSFDKDGNPRAFLWQNGVMTDLNTLIPDSSPLYLLFADAINSSGEIAGFGAVKSTCMGDPKLCETHAFLAIPNNGAADRQSAEPAAQDMTSKSGQFALSEDVRKVLRERLPLGRFGTRPIGH